ncbi:MAG: peptidoglycan recognition protein family protein [Acidobacteriota bacterium]|nr:peptidoglycan recognition protein family protein [Acidobacteriota bacterium]
MLPLFFAAALALPWNVPVGANPQRVVGATQPFEAAAISWNADSEGRVRVRVSDDGREWSEWIPLTVDDDSSDPSAGRYVTAIAHFGSVKHFVEYAIDGDVDRATVTMFPPAPPPSQRRIAVNNFSFGTLTIRARTDWGCPDGESSPMWAPQHTLVTHAVVHHTAGANMVADWDNEMRNIWYLHTFTNGWGDIGYNFLIDPNGVVYEGRAGGEGIIGAHFSCRNSNTVGVALLGTFTSTPPTDAALASLKNLLTELSRRNGIDPTAIVHHPSSGLNLPTILGHRDGNVPGATCTVTECPGNVLYSMLPAIRSELAQRLNKPAPPRRRAARP